MQGARNLLLSLNENLAECEEAHKLPNTFWAMHSVDESDLVPGNIRILGFASGKSFDKVFLSKQVLRLLPTAFMESAARSFRSSNNTKFAKTAAKINVST